MARDEKFTTAESEEIDQATDDHGEIVKLVTTVMKDVSQVIDEGPGKLTPAATVPGGNTGDHFVLKALALIPWAIKSFEK